MSPRKPKNVVAVTPGGNITMDHIIGFYALFTVPDKPVSASKLTREWFGAGLPHDLIPKSRQGKHAFQVAARSVETRRRVTGTAGHTSEIKADQVMETPTEVIYQITNVLRDKANEQIDHPKTMRVRYNKDTEDIRWEALDRLFGTDVLDDLGHAIQGHYDKNAKKVPGARVRNAIRGLMGACEAQNVRRKAGGVYFVPKDGKSYLDGLNTVLEALYGDDAELHLIFCANAEGERQMIERHLTANVTTEVDELMAEVTGALTGEGRKMRKDRVENILQRRKMMGGTKEKYAAILNTSLDEVSTKLELLDDQLETLVMQSAD
jgi:hypothetical protein